jgi:ElaA protein
MCIKWEIKRFEVLSTIELYKILRLRSEVFIVEQNCVYQDIDDKDEKALHLLGSFDGVIVAYARLFKSGDYFENAAIGRVVVAQKYRNRKWGHALISASISGIQDYFGEIQITISAQLYLKEFYEQNGFIQTSEPYLEDGIPHIEMHLN